jgi:hypothetical protein
MSSAAKKEFAQDHVELIMAVDARGKLALDPEFLDPNGPMARQFEAARRLKRHIDAKRKKPQDSQK